MIKLLELPTVQLEQRIKQEIEENIVLEEANAFFAGTRSAKDAAAILQNRAQTYISESR